MFISKLNCFFPTCVATRVDFKLFLFGNIANSRNFCCSIMQWEMSTISVNFSLRSTVETKNYVEFEEFWTKKFPSTTIILYINSRAWEIFWIWCLWELKRWKSEASRDTEGRNKIFHVLEYKSIKCFSSLETKMLLHDFTKKHTSSPVTLNKISKTFFQQDHGYFSKHNRQGFFGVTISSNIKVENQIEGRI